MGCDIHCWTEVKRDGRWVLHGEGPFDDRSYATFSVLADVRNYDDIPPIDQARGWPEDCSPEMRKERDYIDHSPSSLTLAELMGYDTAQTYENRAFVMRDAAGNFTGWTRAIYKGREGYSYTDADAPYERVGTRTVAEEIEPAWSDALKHLATLGAPDEVRIVFYFDS